MDLTGEPPFFAPVIAAARTVVETVLLSAAPDCLRFRIRTAPLTAGQHPDTLARNLAGFGREAGRLLHSTSWRFTGAVVLTYAALPDPHPATGTVRVPTTAPPSSGDPLEPSPGRIDPGDVAAHACRHLAYLRHTDPLVAASAAEEPHLWDLIDLFTPSVAGLLTPPR